MVLLGRTNKANFDLCIDRKLHIRKRPLLRDSFIAVLSAAEWEVFLYLTAHLQEFYSPKALLCDEEDVRDRLFDVTVAVGSSADLSMIAKWFAYVSQGLESPSEAMTSALMERIYSMALVGVLKTKKMTPFESLLATLFQTNPSFGNIATQQRPVTLSSAVGQFGTPEHIAFCEQKFGMKVNHAAMSGACASGNVDCIRWLLSHPNIDPAFDNNDSLLLAAYYGHVEATNALIQDSRVDPTHLQYRVVYSACKQGRAGVLELFRRDSRLASFDWKNLFCFACEIGRVDMVEYFLKHLSVFAMDPAHRDCISIRIAAQLGHTLVVQLLLAEPSIDPGASNNGAIAVAAEFGHDGVVTLLLKDPRVDPSVDNNFPLRMACTKGHLAVVQRLLNDPRVDPTASLSDALRLACLKNHLDIAAALIEDGRVDPSADACKALWAACSEGHLDLVELLLKDRRVDPSVMNNHPFLLACRNDRDDVVRRLLRDPRVDPSLNTNMALEVSAQFGMTRSVAALLADPRVDPGSNDNFSIKKAAENGHVDTVRCLLADRRVNPAAGANYAIRLASEHGHLEIVDILLGDPRVDPGDDGNMAFISAAGQGRISVVRRLLNESRVDPRAEDYKALKVACYNDQLEMVELLLALYKDIPVVSFERVLSYHCILQRDIKLIHLLLTHPVTRDPAMATDVLLLAASVTHNLLLFKSARGDSSSQMLWINDLLDKGELGFLTQLLDDLEIDPMSWVPLLLEEAADRGNSAAVVELLLDNPRVDVEAEPITKALLMAKGKKLRRVIDEHPRLQK